MDAPKPPRDLWPFQTRPKHLPGRMTPHEDDPQKPVPDRMFGSRKPAEKQHE